MYPGARSAKAQTQTLTPGTNAETLPALRRHPGGFRCLDHAFRLRLAVARKRRKPARVLMPDLMAPVKALTATPGSKASRN